MRLGLETNQKWAIVLLGGVLCGCVAWEAGRVPFAAPAALPLQPSPAIYVSYRAENRYGGAAPVRPQLLLTPRIDEAYLRVRRESPLLANSTTNRGARVNYVLVLDATENHVAGTQYMIGVASLFLFPGGRWKEFAVEVKLRDAASGEVVSRATTSSRVEELVWLPMLPLMPLSMAIGPGSEDFYDRTFIDAFNEIAAAIRDRPLPPASDAGPFAIELRD